MTFAVNIWPLPSIYSLCHCQMTFYIAYSEWALPGNLLVRFVTRSQLFSYFTIDQHNIYIPSYNFESSEVNYFLLHKDMERDPVHIRI